MTDLRQWLDALGLSQYAEAFDAQDIDLALLPQLTDADLKEAGVASLGHRKRLLIAIEERKKAQMPPDQSGVPSPKASVPVVPETSAARLTSVQVASPVRLESERRQLTVMFCDLVGSTALSSALDPEDLQGLIGSYHAAVAAAVTAFEGHVAQFLGDGVLVYFGYPRAHEDDAVRAVLAALDAAKAVSALPLQGESRLQTRIGIATGQVVIGHIGTGTTAAEWSATGETPNLAARLQAQAQPGEILVSTSTRRLLGEAFDLSYLGPAALKGLETPVGLWRVVGERASSSRFEARHAAELVRFVGRDAEVSLLLQRWAMAREGEGQVVLLSGEAGIGKSRIGQALREQLSGEPMTTVLLQCSPYFGSSALYPVTQALERMARIERGDAPEQRARKVQNALAALEVQLDPASLGYLLKRLGLPDGDRLPAGQTPQQEKAATLIALVELLSGLARHKPVLFLVEDTHWIDPTTEEFLALAIDRLSDARVLTLLTCRPEYVPTWGNPANLTKFALSRLGQKHCAALSEAVTKGRSLPPEVLNEIVRKTDGIPLFVEELTKTVMESGLLEETGSGFRLIGPLPALAIPSTLQDSLMARLDRIASAKEVAQVGAAIGREFAHRLLAAVMGMPEEKLNEALNELVLRAELVFRRGTPPDAIYIFKHALVQDTAYGSIAKRRRQQLHAAVAQSLVRTFPGIENEQPELLAKHLTEAGQPAEAIPLWMKAGANAAARSANVEAAALFGRGIALLSEVPSTDWRRNIEFELHMARAAALNAGVGYGAQETVAAFVEARDLASVGLDLSKLAMAVNGLCTARWIRGEFAKIETDERSLLAAAQRAADVFAQQLAHRLLSAFRNTVADFVESEFHASASLGEGWEQGLGRTRPAIAMVHDNTVGALLHLAIAVWHQGRVRRASELEAEADRRATHSAHPNTIAFALYWRLYLAFLRRDTEQIDCLGASVEEYSRIHALPHWISYGAAFRGLGTEATANPAHAIVRLEEILTAWQRIGNRALITGVYGQLAQLHRLCGGAQSAMQCLAKGLAETELTGESWYQPELLRLKAALLSEEVSPAAFAQAQAALHDAIRVAERQGAHMHRIRAVVDLSALLARAGEDSQADALKRQLDDELRGRVDDEVLLPLRAI